MATDRKAAALAKRRSQAIDAYGAVAGSIGPIAEGMSLFLVTRGQWSMIDLVRYLVHSVGRASVSVWTWTVADYEVEVVEAMMADSAIDGARLIIDYSASKRNAVLLAAWQARFGEESVRVCRTHAKIARVWNGDWRFLARGSMNLNYNPRFEQCDLTEGGKDYELVREMEDAMPVVGLNPSFDQVADASGLGRAFERKTLDWFAGVPTWKP